MTNTTGGPVATIMVIIGGYRYLSWVGVTLELLVLLYQLWQSIFAVLTPDQVTARVPHVTLSLALGEELTHYNMSLTDDEESNQASDCTMARMILA